MKLAAALHGLLLAREVLPCENGRTLRSYCLFKEIFTHSQQATWNLSQRYYKLILSLVGPITTHHVSITALYSQILISKQAWLKLPSRQDIRLLFMGALFSLYPSIHVIELLLTSSLPLSLSSLCCLHSLCHLLCPHSLSPLSKTLFFTVPLPQAFHSRPTKERKRKALDQRRFTLNHVITALLIEITASL